MATLTQVKVRTHRRELPNSLGPLIAVFMVLLLLGGMIVALIVVKAGVGRSILRVRLHRLHLTRSRLVLLFPHITTGREPPRLGHGAHLFRARQLRDQRKQQRFWRTLLNTRPQLFVFNGDIVYGDCANASSCEELPTAWRDLFNNDNFGVARAEVPLTGVLDDHDYGQNDCHALNPHKGLARRSSSSALACLQPTRATRPGLYTAHTFGPIGRRTQIILTDSRWFRSRFVPSTCAHAHWPLPAYCLGQERTSPTI